jgi:hypothetical protein
VDSGISHPLTGRKNDASSDDNKRANRTARKEENTPAAEGRQAPHA